MTRTIQWVNAEARNVHRAPPGAHGAHAVTRPQPATLALAQEILGILDGAGLGHILAADKTAAELLAVCLRRIYQAEEYLDRFGLTAKSGAVRPVAQLLVQLLREARGYAEALGMTPLARAKLGLETGKAFDIAAALASMPASNPPTASLPEPPELSNVAALTSALPRDHDASPSE